MNEDFFTRLDKYMEYNGLNDNKVTVKSGIPVGSLGKQRKGSRGLSVVNIAKILYSYSDLDADWLITGRGDMIKKSPISNNIDNIDKIDNIELIKMLMDQLGEKNEEIGRLKEKITGLIDDIRRMKETDVARDADTGHSAAG